MAPDMNCLFCKQEASMGRVLEKFSQHAKIDQDQVETELYAAFKALEVDPENLTIEELRECLMIYLDEIFYGISPDKVQ
jgi:hypothetical protein